MSLLTIPIKNKQNGIKIKCLKCKYQLSDTCKLTNKRLSQCEYKDKHRYNLVVHVPNTRTSRKSKIINTKDYSTASMELLKFKKELEDSCYHGKRIKLKKEATFKLVDLATQYIDMLNGVNTPKHLIRVRSKDHISETRRVIERFCICLKKKSYNLEILAINDVTDTEVEHFHNYIIDELKLLQSAYNKHFVIMKTFFNWVIKVKEYAVKNPFAHAELVFDKKEVQVLTKEIFERLMGCITEDNGWEDETKKRLNFYRPWLEYAFRLGLETGLRTEELVSLKWNDLVQIQEGISVFRISNLKVNRIQSGKDSGKYIKHIPVTKSLNSLLVAMGRDTKIGSDEYLIPREHGETTNYMGDFISRAFSHYIKLNRVSGITFKHLRKTYLTRLTMKLGDDAKYYTNNTDTKVLRDHYLSSAFMASNLNDFEIL